MCKYAVIQVLDDEATESGKAGKVLALRNDLGQAFDYGEKYVADSNAKVEIFERISTGKPVTSVAWEGRRRPALTGSGNGS
jgi:hypothetical protein